MSYLRHQKVKDEPAWFNVAGELAGGTYRAVGLSQDPEHFVVEVYRTREREGSVMIGSVTIRLVNGTWEGADGINSLVQSDVNEPKS